VARRAKCDATKKKGHAAYAKQDYNVAKQYYYQAIADLGRGSPKLKSILYAAIAHSAT
jgi:hypothetical protein